MNREPVPVQRPFRFDHSENKRWRLLKREKKKRKEQPRLSCISICKIAQLAHFLSRGCSLRSRTPFASCRTFVHKLRSCLLILLQLDFTRRARLSNERRCKAWTFKQSQSRTILHNYNAYRYRCDWHHLQTTRSSIFILILWCSEISYRYFHLIKQRECM